MSEAHPFITEKHMRNFWQFRAKRQTHAGVHQGKWCVYRPDGIRLIPTDSRKDAEALAWALNYAAAAFATEGLGDWRTLLAKG